MWELYPSHDLLLFSLAYSLTLRMGGICSSETSVDVHHTTQRHISKGTTLYSHRSKNLKFCVFQIVYYCYFTDTRARIRSRYSGWLRAGRRRGWSSIPGRVKIFLLSTSCRPVLGPTQPPIHWSPWAVSSQLKRPGPEANHSRPSSAEVKNGAVITLLPQSSSWRSA
jgi:hypothetical protein